MTRKTIPITEYVAAFETWGRVAKRDPAERALIAAGGAYLLQQFRGDVAIETLCMTANAWCREQRSRSNIGDVGKSCLLSRLIYGGEQLRTRPCPIHGGRWSGCHYIECPAGCNYGINLTGWLPNDQIERWPSEPDDAPLATAAAQVRTSWDRAHAMVYADRLQALGDPRGELIAVDLARELEPTQALAARHAELVKACFGPLFARSEHDELRNVRALEHVDTQRGFLDVEVASGGDVRRIFNCDAGRFLRRLVVRADAWSLCEALAVLSMRPHAWLVELVLDVTAESRPSDGLSKETSRALIQHLPNLATVRVRSRAVLEGLAHFQHPTAEIVDA